MDRNEAIKKAIKGTKDYEETMISILRTFSVQKPQKSANFDEIKALYDGRYTQSRYHSEKHERYWTKIGNETKTYVKFVSGNEDLIVCWKCANQIQDMIAYLVSDTILIRTYYNTPCTCVCCGEFYSGDIPF